MKWVLSWWVKIKYINWELKELMFILFVKLFIEFFIVLYNCFEYDGLLFVVVFDMDGLIFNFEDFYDVVCGKLLVRCGKIFLCDIKFVIMGKIVLIVLLLLCELSGIDEFFEVIWDEVEIEF